MKHVLIVIAVLVVAGITFWQFTIPKNNTIIHQEMVYLGDQTEEDFALVTAHQLVTLSVASNLKTTHGERFRIAPINQLALNPVVQLSLPNVPSKWLGNAVQRKKEVQRYREQLSVGLQEVKRGRENKPGSVIFQVVARELQRLTKSNADNRILVINSDLMEKSRLSNFYRSHTLNRLQHTPDSVIADFVKAHPIPDLSGIVVFLVYEPKTRVESLQFDLTSRLYERMLGALGARVIISANLIADS